MSSFLEFIEKKMLKIIKKIFPQLTQQALIKNFKVHIFFFIVG